MLSIQMLNILPIILTQLNITIRLWILKIRDILNRNIWILNIRHSLESHIWHSRLSPIGWHTPMLELHLLHWQMPWLKLHHLLRLLIILRLISHPITLKVINLESLYSFSTLNIILVHSILILLRVPIYKILSWGHTELGTMYLGLRCWIEKLRWYLRVSWDVMLLKTLSHIKSSFMNMIKVYGWYHLLHSTLLVLMVSRDYDTTGVLENSVFILNASLLESI